MDVFEWALEQHQRAVEASKGGLPTEAASPLVGAHRAVLPFAPGDDWLASKVLESIPEATRKSYGSAFAALKPHIEHGDIPDDRAVLDRIKELEAEGRSVSSMRAAMSTANFVRRHTGHPPLGLAPGEAIKAIDRIRQQQGRDAKKSAPIRSSDLPRIEAAAARRRAHGVGMETEAGAERRATLDSLIVRLARAGMMRVSELERCSLDNLEADGNEATLTFKRSKRGLDGTIVIGERLLALIHAVEREPGDRRIIPLSKRQIERRIKRMAEEAGIRGASSHGARVGVTRDIAALGESLVRRFKDG